MFRIGYRRNPPGEQHTLSRHWIGKKESELKKIKSCIIFSFFFFYWTQEDTFWILYYIAGFLKKKKKIKIKCAFAENKKNKFVSFELSFFKLSIFLTPVVDTFLVLRLNWLSFDFFLFKNVSIFIMRKHGKISIRFFFPKCLMNLCEEQPELLLKILTSALDFLAASIRVQ